MRISKDVKLVARKLLAKHFPKRQVIVFKELHSGYTNNSFFVELDDNSQWQVRIPHDGNIINRQTECAVLKAVSNDDFLYFDPKTGIAIKKWITAKNPNKVDIRKKEFCDELFAKIKDIHATKLPKGIRIKKIDLDAYNQNLYRLKFIYQKKYLCILDRHMDDEMVLNHTDINPLNILYSKDKKVHLIDYEWAALANDYWDYANYIRESKLNYLHIDWSKYIKNFDMKKLKENIFVSSVYAYLWTFVMPQSKKIVKYRSKAYKQIKKHYHAVINFDHDKIREL